MKNRKKFSKFQTKNVKYSFTGTQLTHFAGLSSIMKYIKKQKIGQSLNALFPTPKHNSTKFTNVQLMLAVILASLAGINRLRKIAWFTSDPLVMALLWLKKGLNKDVISTRFKSLGQAGAISLHEYILKFMTVFLAGSQLQRITLDVDSTVKTVYGNQQGAAKGYNSKKPGAKSYHPLLAFISETKLLVNSWFRTGSAYTSNGICDFIAQTKAILPKNISHVFFRADSGFFTGALFDLLESTEYQWTYLVKVKLKNLSKLLQMQQWHQLSGNPNIAICEFSYRPAGWSNKRIFKAVRIVKGYELVNIMGKLHAFPRYEYACYMSNLGLNGYQLHELYKQRATSENWIEEVKNQLLAGKTFTNDFYANDILWQLGCFAYNLSVMMRHSDKKLSRQEHSTFRDWFILIPAKIVRSGGQIIMKIYENYYYKEQWIKFSHLLLA